MKTLLCLLALAVLLPLSAAETAKRCVTCGAAISGTHFTFKSPTLGDNQPVCGNCSKLKERCAICKLPVPAHARKLDDGRFFCESDHRAGVFDANEARQIFEQVRREVAAILAGYGILPDRGITVALASSAELRKSQLTLPSEHDGEGTLGLTRTESVGRKQFSHRISLITGLPRNQLAAVCAHEYTHTWLAENLPPARKLEKDTIEGFCELIAYKAMVQRRDEQQKRIILDNAYTRGQINAFIEAEQQHHFHRVVNWMRTGEDEILSKTNKAQVLATGPDDEAAPVWPPPGAVRTRVPDALTLKGISGAASRRFALINDATLARNEEGKVRVGTSNVVVRCLDIRAGSVVIQVKGAAHPTELFLAIKD